MTTSMAPSTKNSKKTKTYQATLPSFPAQMPPDDIDVSGMGDISKFQPLDIDELDNKINRQLHDFSSLLNQISSIEDKTRSLWKQIFENAVQDRKNAYIMWSDLYMYVHAHSTEHAIHGQNLSRYMERMSKANDQIIKLAELVAHASNDQMDDMMTEEEMYDNILKTNQSQ